MAGRISIVILNWNRAQETLDCLQSLVRLDYPDYKIIVVDNGSTDGSAGRIRGAWPAIELIETGANLGYGGGNNAGIRAALAAGSDFIWLLNNDTCVAQDALGTLLETADLAPDVGIVSPKILFAGEDPIIWFGGGTYDARRGICVHYSLGQPDKGQVDQRREISFATGCSLFVRRKVFEQAGLFDESYFLYWEDVDFCFRVREAGWRIIYEPRARVTHLVGGSSDEPGGTSALFDYYSTRNRLWFLRRRARRPLTALLYTLFLLARRAASIYLHDEANKKEKLAALMSGMRDGVVRS